MTPAAPQTPSAPRRVPQPLNMSLSAPSSSESVPSELASDVCEQFLSPAVYPAMGYDEPPLSGAGLMLDEKPHALAPDAPWPLRLHGNQSDLLSMDLHRVTLGTPVRQSPASVLPANAFAPGTFPTPATEAAGCARTLSYDMSRGSVRPAPMTPLSMATNELRLSPTSMLDETPVRPHPDGYMPSVDSGQARATPHSGDTAPWDCVSPAHMSGLPTPMTPLTRSERPHVPSHSSSYASLTTPDYASTRHSVSSSADLRSPGLVPDTHVTYDASPTPHKPTACYGVDMPMPYPYVMPPDVPVGLPLDDPFVPQYSVRPSPAHGTPSPSPALFCGDMPPPGATPPVMPRVLPPTLPTWPDGTPMTPHTPLAESTSFPSSPVGGGSGHGLPLSSVAMARKCFTPYAKCATLPMHEGDMFAPPMSASKSMGALASPLPLSPAASRRGFHMAHSMSMPGDQMASLAEPSPAARTRGRSSGPPPLVVSSADKLHVCHCGRRFKRMEHLKRHNRTHTQERPHKCPVANCGKSFGRSDNLAQHLKTHFRPAGLVGRSSDLFRNDEVMRARDMRHDPYAAAAVAARAAAAAMSAPGSAGGSGSTAAAAASVSAE